MKKIILIIMLLILAPFVYSISECNKVSFCGGSYNLTCEPPIIGQSDGYCPEDYGNWDSCKLNSYGTKCFPCDIDCALAAGRDCGNIIISVPSNPFPGEQININVTIYNVDESFYTEGSSFPVFLYYNLPGNQAGVAICSESHPTCSCENNICNVKNFVNKQTPTIGGNLFTYGAFAQGVFSNTVWGYGVTKPNVNIEQPPQQSTQSGTFTITTMAFSAYTPDIFTGYSGITSSGRVILDITGATEENGGGEGTPSNNKLTRLELYLFKETYPGNYEEADPDNNCATCSTDDCNLISSWTKTSSGGFIQSGTNDEYFAYSWDSSGCGGDIKDFKIIAVAYDSYYPTGGSASDDVYFTLENENAPCIENCPKVSSNLLNLIVSKIKVWL